MEARIIPLGYTGQIEGSGELVVYPDAYKNVTQEDVKDATHLEDNLVKLKTAIEGGYYQMAVILDEFDARKLFLARGYPTFKAWCNGPEVDIGGRLAHDMLRLVREVAPLFEDDAIELNAYGVSKARALLPLLSDDEGEKHLMEVYEATKDLTVRDTVEYVKEIRGIARPIDADTPAIFTARVKRGDSFHKVTVTRTGNDSYPCGVLSIKPVDWPRWEERFGRFVEVQME